MAETYENAYREFTSKFDLDGLNLKDIYEVNRKLNGLNDFAFDSTPKKKEQNIYLDTLNDALKTYLEGKTKIEEDKAYNMSDVSIVDFVKEFDKVMNAIRTDAAPEGEPYNHTPFAGASEGVMAARAWNKVKHFNQSLGGIWGDQIRNGTLTIEKLQSVTRSSVSMLDGMVKNDIKYTDVAKKDLANVVMAKNAMAEAINKRSWTSWLNPLNWGSNRRENAYLNELENKIEAYKQAGFPTDNVVPEEYTSNMLGNARSELQKTYGAINQPAQPAQTAAKPEKKKEAKVQKKSEPAKKKANKKEAVKPISDKVMEAESNRFEEYIDDFCEYMKEAAGVNIGAYKMVIKMNIPNALGKMGTLNQNFENPVKGVGSGMLGTTSSKQGVAPEDIVKEMATSCFDYFYGNSVSFGVSRGSDKSIAAAQAATNYIMSKFSPAVTDPEKYGKYADNYVVKDDKLLSELTGIKAGSKEITSARNILQIKPEDVIKEPDRTNMNLKPEDIENNSVNQELSGKAINAPEKTNNLIK